MSGNSDKIKYMSVLKNKRNLSKLEFYHTARKMRREIIELLRRDFGIHSRSSAHKSDSNLPKDYYDEDIKHFADNIRTLLRNLMWNITAGNTIYPVNEAELSDRRLYQDRAIIACQQLHQEFLFAEDALPVNVSKFVPYIEMINFEEKLLKGWRKANNKLLDEIKNKEGKIQV